jgi:hypothetical protein
MVNIREKLKVLRFGQDFLCYGEVNVAQRETIIYIDKGFFGKRDFIRSARLTVDSLRYLTFLSLVLSSRPMRESRPIARISALAISGIPWNRSSKEGYPNLFAAAHMSAGAKVDLHGIWQEPQKNIASLDTKTS